MYDEAMKDDLSSKGQALVEYVLLVAFLVVISSRMVTGFTDFMRESIGNLGHVLSLNMSVGVCQRDCFYTGYENGPPGQ